jgi:hypothetical protein
MVVAVPAAAIGRPAKAQQIPGEDAFRSVAGYHAAVMEHCKAINKLARGRGAFNVELAREHAAEVSRNLTSASRHVESYLAAPGADKGTAGVVGSKQGESERLAAALGQALGGTSPDRKAVAAAATELYLAERDLVTAHKTAGKTLGIRPATAPRKASPRATTARKSATAKSAAKAGGRTGEAGGAPAVTMP